MWTKEVQPGGVVGDDNFAIQANTYFEGTAYAQRFVNPIIVYGRIYYKEPFSFSATGGDTVCVDLRTGQEVWRRSDVPALSFAMIYDLETPNYHGVYPAILFTSNFAQAFDADTGKALFNVTNVPTGTVATTVLGPLGEQIRYTFWNNRTTQTLTGTCAHGTQAECGTATVQPGLHLQPLQPTELSTLMQAKANSTIT